MQFPQECEQYEKIIVTRHPRLAEYLKHHGIVSEETPHREHIRIQDIEGKHVIGILPFHLVCHSAIFTEIPLRIPIDKKDEELTMEEIGFCMQQPRTYIINEIR